MYKILKSISLSFCVSLLISFTVVSQSNKELGNAYLDSLRLAKNTPGMSAAIAVNGKMIWEYGSGYSNLDKKKKASPNTLYRIASVSKLITTAAMAKMVQDKKLKFSDDVNKFFKVSDQKMSIAQVLSHTSGIRHYRYNERTDRFPHYDNVIKALEVFINDSLLFTPGEKHQYSSYGIDLIGAIVEKQSKQSFEKYVQKNVLKPLKMKNTFLREPKNTKNLSKFYDGNQTLIPKVDLSYNIPGGGMYSTVQDLTKLGNAFLSDDFVSKQVKEKLFTKAKLNNGKEIDYGLGWIVQKLDDGSEAYYHDGHMDGTHSTLVIYPKYKASISMIANRGSNWGITEALELLCKVYKIEKCPKIVVKKNRDRQYIMKIFQNLSTSFQDFQNALGNSDRSKLEELIANTFQSKVWSDKKTFIDFLMKVESKYEVFDMDLSVKGLEDGDEANVKTIRFLDKQSNKSWSLKYQLNKTQWSLISIDVFE